MAADVASSPLAGHTVLSMRHYEAEPPANLSLDVVDPDNTFSTTKEEEWVTKKKTELTTTRQIETRVKRQVVLEDGKVVDDSGPIVTTNTTEDTETQEHQQTEHRTTGDDPPGPEWVATPGPGGLVKEVKERKVTSREEREERLETEDVQHLGDITDEAYKLAVKSQQSDVRQTLLSATQQSGELVTSSPRVVHQSCKSHKVIDTEDSQQLSQLQEDGRLVTETRRTTEREEVREHEEPDDQPGDHSEEEETRNESSHRYVKTRDQDLVEYRANGVKIGEEMRYMAENIEGEREGEPVADWESLSTRIRRMRRQQAAAPIPADRRDAVTKRPLDFDQEEETRKVETSKWLEHHFGSDSRSSADDDDPPPGSSTSFINVTMKSRPITRTVINGHMPAYTSSRVFVTSPEPPNGYFQGVSEWSERRNLQNNVVAFRQTNGRHSPYHTQQVESPSRSPYNQSPDYVMQLPEVVREPSPQPPHRRRHNERIEEEHLEPEPSPPTSKKIYQRTRFAADIPPPPQPRAKSPGQSATSIIKKLVGKFRSSSSERKNKRRNKKSRSPSPPGPTYQQYNIPVPPPRAGRSSQPAMERPVQRFYLGEDPFRGSIYGREREYDGVTPFKSSRRHQRASRRGSHEEDLNRTNMNSSTLGRLSKSTSRLTSGTVDQNLSRGAQTLPRKLYTERSERIKNQVYLNRNNETNHSNSMINVSIINNVTPPTSSIGINKPLTTGPVKPARTYRSNLARSKSFNVHAVSPEPSSSLLLGSRSRDTTTLFKSNPHLHRLDESPPPLKSPGILASISRSQRDLTDSSNFGKEESSFEKRGFSRSTSNLLNNSSSTQDAKKKLFMKGLMDRAPELYKTLHGDEPVSPTTGSRIYSSTPLKNGITSSRVLDYNSSFRSSTSPDGDIRGSRPLSSPYRPSTMMNGVDRVSSPVGNKPSYTSTLTHVPSFRADKNGTTTSIVRRGSIGNDDYSETVRITSKSDDPIRPSVTNTIQSYSKKKVPTRGGHSTETIESSETTTVTKSRYRGAESPSHNISSNHYSMRNGGVGGVVIEVRPSRK